MDRVGEVESALRDGDLRGAIAACLAAWRQNRSVVIAGALERLTTLAWQDGPPHRLRSGLGYDEDWRALATRADPAEVGWLASTLYARLPVKISDWPRPEVLAASLEGQRARVLALGPHLPDPRVAKAFGWLLRNTHGLHWLPARERLDWVRWALTQVEAAGDPRSDGVIHGDDRMESWWEVAAEYRPAPVVVLPLSADEEARWQAIGRPPVVDVGPLIDEVVAHPDDDGPRRVLAEVLQAAGHDRGELIALQLGPRSEASDQRIRALLRHHRAEWLGPLHVALAYPVFERGFLSRAQLALAPMDWGAARWEEASRSPVLATLTTLRLGSGPRDRYLDFLRGSARANLRRVEAQPEVWRALVGGELGQDLRAIEFPEPPSRQDLQQLRVQLPKVDTLRITGVTSVKTFIATLIEAGWGPRLRALELAEGVGAPKRALTTAQTLFSMTAALPALEVRWVGFGDDCYVSLSHGVGRVHFAKVPSNRKVEARAWAQVLPADLQRVVVDEGPHADAFEEALRGRGLVVERQP